MSSMMRPVGPQPPNVYWRRRVLAVVVLLLVLALLIWAVTALIGAFGGGDEPGAQAPAPSGSGTVSPTSSPGGSPSADGAQCTARDVQVVATADSRTHQVGDTAQIGMTITNTSDETCTIDVGSAALTILVTSGSDQIWSSDDCEVDSRSNIVDLEGGKSMESAVPWKTERSGAGCESGLPPIRPGTYQVVSKAGELTSDPLTVTVQPAATQAATS